MLVGNPITMPFEQLSQLQDEEQNQMMTVTILGEKSSIKLMELPSKLASESNTADEVDVEEDKDNNEKE